jgi:hypothetical protein
MLALAAPGARAGYPDEHPELFGITSAPPEGTLLVDSSGEPKALLVRPVQGETVGKLLSHLGGTALVILHAGPEDKAALEGIMTAAGLNPADSEFIDVEQVNTSNVGEYAPFWLQGPGGLLILDPPYLPDRPYDDAVGSKLAAALATCAYRPPTFLTRAFLDSDGDGRCIVASKLFAKTPALSEAEIKGQLKLFLGCKEIIVLQSLQGDGEGRLDTFFRFATPNKVFIGTYEVEQEGVNLTILNGNREILETSLPEAVAVQTIAMPTPIEVGQSKIRPSYLAYVRLQGKILVPTFAGDEKYENDALATLGQTFVASEVVALDSTTLVKSGSRLNAVLVPFPGAVGWDVECEQPVPICQSGKPSQCPELCWDECLKGEATCVSETKAGKCVMGEDGCRDLEETKCPESHTCAQGACKPPPSICDTIPPEGLCDGEVLKVCVDGQVIAVDCEEENKFCAVGEDGNMECVTPCYNSCSFGQTSRG